MELSEDDVLHILKLIDESKFDYFQLEVGELKITVSKGEPIPLNSAPQQVATAATAPPAPVSAKPAAARQRPPLRRLHKLRPPVWKRALPPKACSRSRPRFSGRFM